MLQGLYFNKTNLTQNALAINVSVSGLGSKAKKATNFA
jgi:hypothetical protein